MYTYHKIILGGKSTSQLDSVTNEIQKFYQHFYKTYDDSLPARLLDVETLSCSYSVEDTGFELAPRASERGLLSCIPRNMPIRKDLHTRKSFIGHRRVLTKYIICVSHTRSFKCRRRQISLEYWLQLHYFLQVEWKREQCKHSEQEISNIVYTSAVEPLITELNRVNNKTNLLNWTILLAKILVGCNLHHNISRYV
ncbi:Hypothetical_protein [Hexamita inflata]|uniref:Hypothetical_protein n=1 Tax=Hexamita inflata TaxID=28002 RepID=A0ABP1KHM0_9EUKA